MYFFKQFVMTKYLKHMHILVHYDLKITHFMVKDARMERYSQTDTNMHALPLYNTLLSFLF